MDTKKTDAKKVNGCGRNIICRGNYNPQLVSKLVTICFIPKHVKKLSAKEMLQGNNSE